MPAVLSFLAKAIRERTGSWRGWRRCPPEIAWMEGWDAAESHFQQVYDSGRMEEYMGRAPRLSAPTEPGTAAKPSASSPASPASTPPPTMPAGATESPKSSGGGTGTS